eukprot:Rmarinus@m.11568
MREYFGGGPVCRECDVTLEGFRWQAEETPGLFPRCERRSFNDHIEDTEQMRLLCSTVGKESEEVMQLTRSTGIARGVDTHCFRLSYIRQSGLGLGFFVRDFLHDVLEGVGKLELREFAIYLYSVDPRLYRSLVDDVETFLAGRAYSNEKTRGVLPRHPTHGCSIGGKGASTKKVLAILPLVLMRKADMYLHHYDVEGSQQYRSLLSLSLLIHLLWLPSFSIQTMELLVRTLSRHQRFFVECYGSARLVSKHHGLFELVRSIFWLGPIRDTDTSRLEGENYFVGAIMTTSNFHNVPASFAANVQWRQIHAQLSDAFVRFNCRVSLRPRIGRKASSYAGELDIILPEEDDSKFLRSFMAANGNTSPQTDEDIEELARSFLAIRTLTWNGSGIRQCCMLRMRVPGPDAWGCPTYFIVFSIYATKSAFNEEVAPTDPSKYFFYGIQCRAGAFNDKACAYEFSMESPFEQEKGYVTGDCVDLNNVQSPWLLEGNRDESYMTDVFRQCRDTVKFYCRDCNSHPTMEAPRAVNSLDSLDPDELFSSFYSPNH